MTENWENKNISFKAANGRESTVKIVSEKPLNESRSYGKIFDTVIEVGGHERNFVVKKYLPGYESDRLNAGDEQHIKDTTQNAFRYYTLAKKAGLKVFTTFRISEDQKSILMTSGFLDNNICLGSNNVPGIKDFNHPPIGNIENVDEFLQNFFSEGLKAAKSRLELYSDAYFFIVSRDNPTKLDFVLGDLDNLVEKEKPMKETGFYNIEHIKDMLIEFCGKNITPEYAKNFMEKVDRYFKEAENSIENSDLE
ncbi:MAG TPA: hypothetical protein VG694_00850 [Candidatus Paceibacterota bacterium]|nr:hypothetical protein [Candidatus Paceibacterota bacterium]